MKINICKMAFNGELRLNLQATITSSFCRLCHYNDHLYRKMRLEKISWNLKLLGENHDYTFVF